MMPQFARLAFNSSLGNHSADLGICHKARTTSALTLCQIPKSNQSEASNTRISKNSPAITPNTTTPKALNFEFLSKGIFIFCIGLFKKVFIADSFAKWADAGFSLAAKPAALNAFEAWASSLSYTFQLYFDFSGYCDMALGLGLMFGIVLPLNFASPYKARNIADFWRTWHITLGRFLRECLYIPLGGNKVRKVLNLRNLFIVALLSGIWHGAGWGFVIWGVMHGVAMCVHRAYSWVLPNNSSLGNHSADLGICHKARTTSALTLCQIPKNNQSEASNTRIDKKFISNTKIKFLNFTKTKLYKALAWLLTFNFINLAWVFFRADDLKSALNLIKAMFGVNVAQMPEKWHRMPELLAHIGGRNDTLFYILIAIFVCLFAKNSWEFTQRFNANSPKKLYFYSIFAAILSLISLYLLYFAKRQSEFLYFNF